jgi:hypothetical protein
MARKFTNWLKAYMNYTRDSESPTSFHFWTGVSVLAGALRRRVWIDMKKFQWTPNFYIILVGPPGVAAKSTSISMGMDLLSKVQGIKFGPESMTWQKLARSLSDAIEHVEYTNSAGEKDRIPMSCLTIQVSELGTFIHAEDDQLLSFLIRMWDGQRDKFRHETVGGGTVEIDNPWLNVISATTPAWLKANFPESMVSGGLTSRVVFVYGDKKRSLIPYPDEVIANVEYHKLRSDLIADLGEISKLAGPYQLSPFAREWGRAWYADHNNPDLRPPHLSSERFGGYLARKQTHLHKFAIILAAAKRSSLTIEEDDLKESDSIISDNERDMIQVFESIGVTDQRSHVNEIVSIVHFSGFMTSKGLWSRSMNHMTLREFEEAVRAAIHGRQLEITIQNGLQGVIVPKKGP